MNFWWPYGIPKRIRDEAARLFERANTAARAPELYEAGGIADTLDGRFQALGLFVALSVAAESDKKLRQALFDKFFMTCEVSLREMGVGDLAVPYKLKTMMKAFHGHALAYQEALQTGQWDDPLSRNLYPGAAPSAAQLAVVKAAIADFQGQQKIAA